MASRISEGEDSRQLLGEYNVAMRELDKKNQQLHELQRKLRESEMLRLNEVELLQAELDSNDSKKLNAQIIHLKETISEIRLGKAGTISSLESEVLNKDQEISKLKSEIEELRSKNVSIYRVDESTASDDLFSLKEENEALQSIIGELREGLDKSHELLAQSEINLNVKKCQQELLETKQCLDAKKEQLTEALTLIEKLNDDLRCSNSELDNLRTKPLDQESKGNSLFAEVDDRRVYLQKKIDFMKSDYLLLKKERYEHLKQITYLRTELASLMEKHKKDLKEIEIDKYEIDQAVKERLNILEQLIETNKSENNLPNLENPVERMTMVPILIQRKNKEIEELKQKLSSQALNQVLLSTSLAQANQEKRKWKMEAFLRRNEERLKDVNNSLKDPDDMPKWKQVETGPNLPDHSTKVEESKKVNLNLHTRKKLFQKYKEDKLKTASRKGGLEEKPCQITVKTELLDTFNYDTFNNSNGKENNQEDKGVGLENVEKFANITTRRTVSQGIMKKSSVLSESMEENLNRNENHEISRFEDERHAKSVTFTGSLPADENSKSKPRRIPGKVIISKPVFINSKK